MRLGAPNHSVLYCIVASRITKIDIGNSLGCHIRLLVISIKSSVPGTYKFGGLGRQRYGEGRFVVFRAMKDHVNVRILHRASKAQGKGGLQKSWFVVLCVFWAIIDGVEGSVLEAHWT